jgi:uncharacterized protein HemY
LSAIGGLVILVGLFLFFTVFLAVAVVFAIGFGIRWWWATRKFRKRAERRADDGVIDASYHVVEAEVIEPSRESDERVARDRGM